MQKKIKALQSAISEFEHAMIADDDALNAFFNSLRELVDACNRIYHGLPLYLSGNKSTGTIFIRPSGSGHESIILSISYSPVYTTLYQSHIRRILSNNIHTLDQEQQLFTFTSKQ